MLQKASQNCLSIKTIFERNEPSASSHTDTHSEKSQRKTSLNISTFQKLFLENLADFLVRNGTRNSLGCMII